MLFDGLLIEHQCPVRAVAAADDQRPLSLPESRSSRPCWDTHSRLLGPYVAYSSPRSRSPVDLDEQKLAVFTDTYL